MKNLVKGAMFLALVGTIMVGCEKEALDSQSVDNVDKVDGKKSKKKVNNKSDSDYPIIIYEDLSEINNLVNVLGNLEKGEFLYSEIVNGIQHNEIQQNLASIEFPNNPNDPELNGMCHIEQSGCLAWIAAIHNYNLDHCDGSSVGYGADGNMVVTGSGCDIA